MVQSHVDNNNLLEEHAVKEVQSQMLLAGYQLSEEHMHGDYRMMFQMDCFAILNSIKLGEYKRVEMQLTNPEMRISFQADCLRF